MILKVPPYICWPATVEGGAEALTIGVVTIGAVDETGGVVALAVVVLVVAFVVFVTAAVVAGVVVVPPQPVIIDAHTSKTTINTRKIFMLTSFYFLLSSYLKISLIRRSRTSRSARLPAVSTFVNSQGRAYYRSGYFQVIHLPL
jgi:hypothetical protein